jgi:hypothetical protein
MAPGLNKQAIALKYLSINLYCISILQQYYYFIGSTLIKVLYFIKSQF